MRSWLILSVSFAFRKGGEKDRHRAPDILDYGQHVITGRCEVDLPIWNSLVQIKNGLTLLKANLVKEQYLAIEALSDTVTVIDPHRDRERDPVEQILRQFALDMGRRVAASRDEAVANEGMYRLGEGLRTRRPDDVG